MDSEWVKWQSANGVKERVHSSELSEVIWVFADKVSKEIKKRAVAQLGSALVWGTRGRRFKSCQSDHPESAS